MGHISRNVGPGGGTSHTPVRRDVVFKHPHLNAAARGEGGKRVGGDESIGSIGSIGSEGSVGSMGRGGGDLVSLPYRLEVIQAPCLRAATLSSSLAASAASKMPAASASRPPLPKSSHSTLLQASSSMTAFYLTEGGREGGSGGGVTEGCHELRRDGAPRHHLRYDALGGERKSQDCTELVAIPQAFGSSDTGYDRDEGGRGGWCRGEKKARDGDDGDDGFEACGFDDRRMIGGSGSEADEMIQEMAGVRVGGDEDGSEDVDGEGEHVEDEMVIVLSMFCPIFYSAVLLRLPAHKETLIYTPNFSPPPHFPWTVSQSGASIFARNCPISRQNCSVSTCRFSSSVIRVCKSQRGWAGDRKQRCGLENGARSL